MTNCVYTGNYEDYNGDPIEPLVVNYMSYYVGCRNSFTPGQMDRALFHYYEYREPYLDNLFCNNFNDEVEFEDTDVGLDRIHLQFTHPFETRFSTTLTNNIGEFHAALYEDELLADVRLLGKEPDFGFVWQDWVEGVTTYDMVLVRGFILKDPRPQFQLNGYQQLAADVNGSGAITTSDLVEMAKLILYINENFPSQSQPMRFIPEYVPHYYADEFHNDPFDMPSIENEPGAPYIEPDWVIPIADGNNGISGFDAIKLGDVNGSFANEPPINCQQTDPARILVESVPLDSSQEVIIRFAASGFDSIVAFQAGFHFDNDQLELVDVYPADLPGFDKNDNTGLTKLTDNEFRVAWYDTTLSSVSLENGKDLFELRVKARTNIADLSAALFRADSVLETAFYLLPGCTSPVVVEGFVEYDLTGRSSAATEVDIESTSNRKMRIYPNPFRSEFQVVVELERGGEGMLELSDISGKKVKAISVSLREGTNVLSFGDLAR
ncbi:MAG: hypothetical protein D6816_19595, partial [Bacteroidetes bacterium]